MVGCRCGLAWECRLGTLGGRWCKGSLYLKLASRWPRKAMKFSLPVIVKVSDLVAVYVLVPWTKVVLSGQNCHALAAVQKGYEAGEAEDLLR